MPSKGIAARGLVGVAAGGPPRRFRLGFGCREIVSVWWLFGGGRGCQGVVVSTVAWRVGGVGKYNASEQRNKTKGTSFV